MGGVSEVLDHSPRALDVPTTVPEGPATLGLARDILERLVTLTPDEVEVVLATEAADMAGLGASNGGTGGRRLVTV